MRPFRSLTVLAFLLLVGGCVGFQLVPPGMVRAGPVELATTAPWNRFNAPVIPSHVEIWTRDGITLDQLLIVKGLEEGRRLLPGQASGSEPPPEFRAALAPDELVEFVFTTFDRAGRGKAYELTRLEPAPFGDRPGFRFAFRSLSRNDLEREGTGLGAIVGNRLYLVVFEASRLHHYPASAEEVDRLLRSARLAL